MKRKRAKPDPRQPCVSKYSVVETSMLVKPAKGGDPYEEFLKDLPELVPPNNRYDAHSGNPNPLTLGSIAIRTRKRIGKLRPGAVDRRRWSKRRYMLLPPEGMYLSQPMDRARVQNSYVEQVSRPLGTGMSFRDWEKVRDVLGSSGRVLTRVVNGRIPPTKPVSKKEMKSINRQLDEQYQDLKKRNRP